MPQEGEKMDTILEVPCELQYLIPDHYWNMRACGTACCRMILDFRRVESPDLLTFTKEAEAAGAYSEHGWVHDKLIEYMSQFGIPMFRKEQMDLDEGIDFISEHIMAQKPVIVSVVKRYLDTTKFHMVLIVGVKKSESSGVLGFYYNDPEWFTEEKGAKRFTTRDQFAESWRKMAIFLE